MKDKGKGQGPPRHQGSQLESLMPEELQKMLLDPSGISFLQDSMLEMAGQVILLT